MNQILYLLQALEPNTNYVVTIEFVAILNDDSTGFYRTKYTKPDGTTSWLAISQFGPTDARKSFPCLDEPDKKAIFNVKLGRKSGMKAISNMPLIRSNESIFIETPTNQGKICFHQFLHVIRNLVF